MNLRQGIRKSLKALDHVLFPQTRVQVDEHEEIIARELENCRTVLDIGCGVTLNSPLYKIAPQFERIVGIDLFAPAIAENKKSGNYTEYHVLDASKVVEKFGPKSFDAVVATDLIEHVDQETGKMLLGIFEQVAKVKIILFTPNGFIPQDEYDGNKYQIHRSGWQVGDFRRLGYKVWGINGLKLLRGEQAKFRLEPIWFWQRISWLTQYVTRYLPRFAFHLLAVKRLPA